MKRGKRLVKLLAGLLSICLLFTSCAPAEVSDENREILSKCRI